MIYPTKLLIPCVDAYSSIIFSNDKATEKAIAENFIRCFSDSDTWIDYFNSYDYNEYGVLRGFKLTSDYIRFNFKSLHKTIDNTLKNKYHIIYSADTYFIRNYKTFQQDHIIHPLFICEKKEKEHAYLCRDYFDFDRYTEQLVSIADIDESFAKNYDRDNNYYNCLLIGFKLDENSMNSFDGLENRKQININKIIGLLTEFLEGFNYLQNDLDYYLKKEANIWKGIHIFDATKLYLEKQMYDPKYGLSSKVFKFLEHHIFMMNKRIIICDKVFHIANSVSILKLGEKVLKDAEILTKYILKYNLRKENQKIKKLIELLDDLKFNYKEVIIQLLEELKKVNPKIG